MSKKADQTASFMVRFNQIIFEEDGESKVQWRGKVSHVQGGEDQSFSDFKDAVKIIQERLADLTIEATKDKSPELQDSLLKKSFSLWKTMAKEGPKVIMETIKDPRKQVAHLQDQISDFGEDLMDKVPIDQWRNASRSDFNTIKESISQLADEMKKLNAKVDAMNTPVKTVRASKTTKPTTKRTTKKTTTPKKK
jgi:polyhydroxyalkanoate synthesis regulator phasin